MITNINIIHKLSNVLMMRGKKSKCEKVLHNLLCELNIRHKTDPVTLMDKLMKKLVVVAEVRGKKQGGTVRLIPTPTPEHRQIPLGLRLFRDAVRNRTEKTQTERALIEIQNINDGRGESLKKRNAIHQQVEMNRANLRSNKSRRHYKW